MIWRNRSDRWGAIAIIIHWTTAVAVVAMFTLGQWMVDLGYYHTWYYQAPYVHKSIGAILFIITIIRLIWRLLNKVPNYLPSHSTFERMAAKAVHLLLYVLLFCVMISGYLISTANGQPLIVFNWFKVPAILYGIEHQVDIAGKAHRICAIGLISVAGLHLLAALKHHLIDKDRTLHRMLGR